MAKAKLSDFKKLLATFSEQEAKDELLKLFNKLPQVQDFYLQELASEEDRKKVVEDCKKKIYNEFWTRSGIPKNVNNTTVKRVISDFEKISVSPSEVIELLLYRVKNCLDMACQFGGTSDANYNTTLTAFEKALKIITKEKLEPFFSVECKELVQKRNNMDQWVIYQMRLWMDEYLFQKDNN